MEIAYQKQRQNNYDCDGLYRKAYGGGCQTYKLADYSQYLFVMESMFPFEIGSICQLCHCAYIAYDAAITYKCDIMLTAVTAMIQI